MRSWLCFALSWVVLLGLPVAAAEQDAGSVALVGKIVQAYGGAPLIERMSSVNAQGDITALMRGAHGSYQRWFARPRMLRVETKYPTGSDTRIFSGERAWSSSGSVMRAATGPGYAAMVYQYKQLDLPYGLLKANYNLRHLGTESVGDKATEMMALWDDEGSKLQVNVDATSYHIVKVTGYISVPGGGSTTLAAVFSDFRPVDGMPMPFRIHNYAGATPLSETVIRSYTVNPPAAPSLFEPPLNGQDSALAPGGTLQNYF
jgi:outer membrane lipoprotein-sorting protein